LIKIIIDGLLDLKFPLKSIDYFYLQNNIVHGMGQVFPFYLIINNITLSNCWLSGNINYGVSQKFTIEFEEIIFNDKISLLRPLVCDFNDSFEFNYDNLCIAHDKSLKLKAFL